MSVNEVVNLVIGFVLGIVASWVFWYWQINIKPRIAISPMCAYDPDSGTLGIRVINRSRQQATDIKVRLLVAQVQGSWYDTIYTPVLNRDSLFALRPYKRPMKFWRLPASAIFETQDGAKIVELLSQQGKTERRLIFTLSATDALSSSKVIQRVSYQLSDIQVGDFKSGRHFVILPKHLT
jgi:hypothetical protein